MTPATIKDIPASKFGPSCYASWRAEAKIDREDIERLAGLQLVKNGAGYIEIIEGAKRTKLHRFLIDAPDGRYVDHKNGDRLDNRKSNLRLCSPAENRRNSRSARALSGYKGVSRVDRPSKWRATLLKGGKRIYLGSYKTRIEAARAYDKGAREHFGEFACLNFPDEGERGNG